MVHAIVQSSQKKNEVNSIELENALLYHVLSMYADSFKQYIHLCLNLGENI